MAAKGYGRNVTMEDEKIIWKPLHTDHIVQDEWIDFRNTVYEMPDGTELGPFYNFSRQNYAVIVATDEAGNYLCVRQFRPGLRRLTMEFPAGGIEHKDGSLAAAVGEGGKTLVAATDPSDVSPEAALEAAKRELREETGYVSDDWSSLMTVASYATLSDNYAFIFRARMCRRETVQDLDDTEFLNVHVIAPDELRRMIDAGEFQQAVHILAYYRALEADHQGK